MKLRIGILGMALLLSALASAQDSLSLARTYVAGDKDVFGASMKMDGPVAVSITFKMTYEVKKVYDNGDGDIELKIYDRVAEVGGQTAKQQDSPPTVTRTDKFGLPAKASNPMGVEQPAFMNFLVYRSPSTMKVGEPVNVDEKMSDKAKTQVKGTAKLESITDGVAKVVTSVDITSEKSKKPMHLDSIAYLDVKTAKLNRAESHLTNIDSEQMQGITSMTVVIEREKAS